MSDTARGSRAGSQFGPYFLTRLLGRGGMGEVYEARHAANQQVVALKLLSPALSHDAQFRERLQVEAHTAGRFQHPHVVPINDHGEIDGQLFLDMRLVEGTDLSSLIKEQGPLAPVRAVTLVRQIAEALDAAHAAGVVHRDVKPENILVTPEDFAYLVDFGIADAAAFDGATPETSPLGTFRYSAPERFTDAPMDHKVDVYSLACVLYECLTGWSPYRGDNAGMLITAHLMRPTPRPSQLRIGVVPEAFDDVIARGMAKDPRQRYASAGDLGRAAYQVLSGSDQSRVADTLERTQVASPPPVSHAQAGLPYPGSNGRGGFAQPPVQGWPASSAPSNHGWSGEFAFPLPHTARRKRPSRLLLAATAVLVVAVLGGAAFWLLRPSHSAPIASSPTTTSSATAAPSPPDTAAQARLLNIIPVGYPPGTCKPIAPPKKALAKVSCGKSSDPDGPQSGTYTLFPDTAAVHFAFNGIVQTSTVFDCPGRIQSPGPWHRNATPDQVSGMLLCATQKANPMVAWTTDAESLVSVVHADPQGPTMDQLYVWWASHS